MSFKEGDRVKTINPLVMDNLNKRNYNDFIIRRIIDYGRRAHLIGYNDSNSWMIEETIYLQLKGGD